VERGGERILRIRAEIVTDARRHAVAQRAADQVLGVPGSNRHSNLR
jgi:hypothetical protein